jgi:hypothetical protein
MFDKSLTDNIDPSEKIGSIMPLGQDNKDLTGSTQSFSSMMQASPTAEQGLSKSQMITPFDLANQGPKAGMAAPNLGTLMSQVQLAQSSMSDLQSQLSYPNLKLKASQKYIAKNKLTDANQNLRAANAKLGAPQVDEQSSGGAGPLARFLNLVSDGMNQLESAKQQLSNLKSQGHNLTPGDFLMIQIKMNKAQQEIDFTSVLLSKAVEATKTLMNVQL